MHSWRVAEVVEIGLELVLLDAGGGYATTLVVADELQPAGVDPLSLPLADIAPGAPGQLNVGHPQACAALSDAAVKAGVRVVTNVSDVAVTPGAEPRLSFAADGKGEEVFPRL